jgi:N utilization substance protein A
MPKSIKFDTKTLDLIRLFNSVTSVPAKDCIFIENDGIVVFIVANQDVGKAIGRKAMNVKFLRDKTQKDIDIIGFMEDPTEFLRNVFLPAKVEEIIFQDRNGQKVAIVRAGSDQKGIIIGRNGRNINKAKLLMRRHFDFDDVLINSSNS